MTTILITGINGFIGAHLARRARDRGWRVIGSDIQARDLFGQADAYLSADLGTATPETFADAVAAADYVLHAGGISGFMVAADDPARILRTNLGGTIAVLEAARRAPPRRLVLCSTIMVYGPDEAAGSRAETEYPQPVSVYGASKLALEAMMQGYHGQHGLDAVALRFSHVYGPGRTTECFIREMMAAAAENRPYRIPQASRSLRQYVHIEDVAQAIELAVAAEAPRHRVFNISAGEVHRLDQVAAAVRAVTGRLDVSFDESRDLPNYRVGALAIERARAELGYVPQLPLALGLRRFWDDVFAPGRGS